MLQSALASDCQLRIFGQSRWIRTETEERPWPPGRIYESLTPCLIILSSSLSFELDLTSALVSVRRISIICQLPELHSRLMGTNWNSRNARKRERPSRSPDRDIDSYMVSFSSQVTYFESSSNKSAMMLCCRRRIWHRHTGHLYRGRFVQHSHTSVERMVATSGLPSKASSGTQNSGARAGLAVMFINSTLMICSQK